MSSPVSVHSFPHVKLGSPSLPIKLEEISSLVLSAQWGMGPGPNTASGLDSGGLSNLQVVANVAYDIWADLDPAKAANDSVAGIEIMIWLGIFGTAQPLGFSKKSSCWRQKLGDAHLYVIQPGKYILPLTRTLQYSIHRPRQQRPDCIDLGVRHQPDANLSGYIPSDPVPLEK